MSLQPRERIQRHLLKFILLGDSSTGKTSLLHQYVDRYFVRAHKATIGTDFLSKDLVLDTELGAVTPGSSGDNPMTVPVTLQLWDTAGQERFHSLSNAFFRGADGCVLVCDVTNLESFHHLGQWMEEFVIQAGRRDVAVLANKCDVEPSKKLVTQRMLLTWCADNGITLLFETSALTNHNIDEAFSALALEVVRRKDSIEKEQKNILAKQQNTLKESFGSRGKSATKVGSRRLSNRLERCCL